MTVAYESTGRIAQKQRTREALLGAARALLAGGVAPTVEQTALEASVSRATAYRYFPDRDALIAAAYPEIEAESLLGPEPPSEAEDRLVIVLEALGRQLVAHETEFRAMLRVSLATPLEMSGLPLRAGRAIGWIEEALEPLRGGRSPTEVHRLAIALRASFGIEPFVWLIDIAGLSQAEALEMMMETAIMRLRAAIR
jgi:AcrR family transcriptional regulator